MKQETIESKLKKGYKIVIEKNHTDDIFHISMVKGGYRVGQIWGNAEDWKNIKKMLNKFFKEEN